METAPTCTVEFAGRVPGSLALTFQRSGGSESLVVMPRAPADGLAVGLPPGRWSIACRQRGQDTVLDTQEVMIVPGSPAQVTLRLQ